MLLNMKLYEMYDYDFDPSDAYDEQPDHSVSIELWHPDDEDGKTYVEVKCQPNLYVEPTEYEGPYVFSQGGFDVEGLEIDETFTFMGKTYKAGTEFPDELIPFVEGGERDLNPTTFYEYITDKLEGRVNVPSNTYPIQR